MNSLDLIRMGLKNLFRRKLRTFLTTLGIIIGTISIVVMVSIGIGMQKTMNESLSKMGNIDIIEVRPPRKKSSEEGNSSSSNRKKEKLITDDDIALIKQIKGVDSVTPVIEFNVSIKGKKIVNDYITVKGMTLDFMKKYGLEINKGRNLLPDDKNTLILGKQTLYDFHHPKDKKWWENMWDSETNELKEPTFNPIGQKLTMSFDQNGGYSFNTNSFDGGTSQPIRPTKINVVGIVSNENYQKSSYAFMEFSKLQDLKDKYDKMSAYAAYGGKKPRNKGYRQVLVHVPERKDIKNVQKEIKQLKFDARSDADMLKESESMATTIKIVFGGIGGIALLVAAIGITNTMVMAIYERRKEIGVMKVIGSSIRDIKKLFLFESSAIGLLGGLLGILASLGLSYSLNNFLSEKLMNFLGGGPSPGQTKITISIIPPWLILYSLIFTSLIGLLAGYLPARKAMKLSALEAIKTE